jgi:hypothetical protein
MFPLMSSSPSQLRLALAGSVVFAAGIAAGLALAAEKPAPEAALKAILDNPRVTVRDVTMAPGARRPSRTRPTDELVFFCEESHYQAIDAQGKTEPRDRLPGTVVFHNKGEQAPTLVNNSPKPIHYFSISLK